MEDFDFSQKKYKYDVEVYCNDQGALGGGCLSFGDGGLISISFDFNERYKFAQKKFCVLKAKAKGGHCFTLFDCTVENNLLFADFVALGDVESGIKSFEVKYGAISDWYLHGRYVRGTIGESIEWINPIPQLKVCIKTAEEDFSLRTDTFGSLTRTGENHVIHEHTRFIFDRDGGEFSVAEVKEKSFELSALLSVLTANPISIVNVWLGLGEKCSLVPIYYPAFKELDRDASNGAFWLSCLVQRQSLEGKWQLVFEKYYASPFRKVSWVRLAGMQRYEGFWEFKILGYVSLLDQYVTSFSAVHGKKAAKAENKKVVTFAQKLKAVKPPLNNSQIEAVRLLAESNFPVPRKLTFREKYDYVISFTDNDILKVVDLTDDDFCLIKDVRDAIAHGDAPDLTGSSYQEIHCIVEKIALLMTYWAHSDFGFSAADFLDSLKYTHNRLSFNPRLNKIHLDRATGTGQFVPVSEVLFEKFSCGDGPLINACFTQDSKGELKYSAEYKAVYEAWLRDRAPERKKDILDVFEVAPDRLRFVDPMYLECGDRIKKIHSVYIVKDI